MPPRRVYDLRHTFATFALRAGISIVFALGHARPMGPIGMALFLAGIAWLELRPRREEAGHAASPQGA